MREIAERLAEALDAAVVKPLPQSGDAVLAQDAAKLSMRPARAVLLLGQVERAAGAAEALLTDRQLEAVSQSAKRYVGLTAAEAARTQPVLRQGRAGDGHGLRVRFLPAGGSSTARRSAPGRWWRSFGASSPACARAAA